MKIPRATGMDISADGSLYVASWLGGDSSVYLGPNVGFVARVTPKGFKAEPLANLKEMNLAGLMRQLSSPIQVARMQAQREILGRGRAAETTRALTDLAND